MEARLTQTKGARRRVGARGNAALELAPLAEAEARTVLIAPADAEMAAAAGNEVDRLYAALSAVAPSEHPRTARLLASSKRKIAQKGIEEAGEVALAAVRHRFHRHLGRDAPPRRVDGHRGKIAKGAALSRSPACRQKKKRPEQTP